MDHVKTAISSLKLAEPTTHGGLTIFPLTSGLDSTFRYLLLEEGLRKELVTIREVSEGGSVPELIVRNRADLPVLIVDGEELVGAKQNRVANLTMLLPAEKSTIIPVSCVEAGRWSYSRPDFGVTDRVQNARGRAEKLADVRESIRHTGSRRSDQGRVWDSLAEESASLEADSPTGAMSAMFDRHRETLDDYVDAVSPLPGQIGAVFIVHNRRCGLDLFDQPDTFAGFLPKLVRSYAIDVLGRRSRHKGAGAPEAQAFLDRILRSTFDDHPAVGLGRDVGIVGEGLVAGALVAGETVLHLTAFAEALNGRRTSGNPSGRGHQARYPSHRQRQDALRRRYGR